MLKFQSNPKIQDIQIMPTHKYKQQECNSWHTGGLLKGGAISSISLGFKCGIIDGSVLGFFPGNKYLHWKPQVSCKTLLSKSHYIDCCHHNYLLRSPCFLQFGFTTLITRRYRKGMWKSQMILLHHKNLLTFLLTYKGSVNLKRLSSNISGLQV